MFLGGAVLSFEGRNVGLNAFRSRNCLHGQHAIEGASH